MKFSKNLESISDNSKKELFKRLGKVGLNQVTYVGRVSEGRLLVINGFHAYLIPTKSDINIFRLLSISEGFDDESVKEVFLRIYENNSIMKRLGTRSNKMKIKKYKSVPQMIEILDFKDESEFDRFIKNSSTKLIPYLEWKGSLVSKIKEWIGTGSPES